jgi:hypothetical protein
MVAIWHHIVVSFKGLAQKGFIGTLIFWMKYIGERLTVTKSVLLIGGCRLNGLRGQEQLALGGVNMGVRTGYICVIHIYL